MELIGHKKKEKLFCACKYNNFTASLMSCQQNSLYVVIMQKQNKIVFTTLHKFIKDANEMQLIYHLR